MRLAELKAAMRRQHGKTHQNTFGDMRETGVRALLVYCADYHCSHSLAISGDNWPDDLRLSEPRFVCQVCGKRGADVRPDSHSEVSGMVSVLAKTSHCCRSICFCLLRQLP